MTITPYSTDHAHAPLGALTGLMISGMPEAVYHSRPEFSTHDEIKFRQAPALYRWSKANPVKPTPSMEEGSARHVLFLQPDRWHELVAVVPIDAPKRPSLAQKGAKKPSEETVAAIAWWDDFNAQSAGKIVLSMATVSEMREQRDAVLADPDSGRYLADGIASEISVFWTDYGVHRRARMDRLRRGNQIVDLKSTSCAAAPKFSRDCDTYGYWIQAATYCDAMESLTGDPWSFSWIAMESEAPWLCPVYRCSPEGIDLGRRGRAETLVAFSECQRSGYWPVYQTGVSELLPNTWALKEVGL